MSMSDDYTSNLNQAARLVKEARKKGAQVVCLPELFDSRYFPQKQRSELRAETIPGEATRALSGSPRATKSSWWVGQSTRGRGERDYNTSVVFSDDGRIIGKYRKVHIPNDPGFYEQAYFSSGNEYQVIKTKYGKLGVLICFDQWYPEAARILKLMEADIIFYPTAIRMGERN